MVSSIERFHSIQDSQLGPDGVLYREVPVYRTANWVPMVSSIERFHSIQDSQLGPDGVLYTEVPLYTYAFLFLGATNSSLRLVAPQVKQDTLTPEWHTHTYVHTATWWNIP